MDKKSNNKRTFSFINLNINGLENKHSSLLDLISKYNADFTLLQETKMVSLDALNFTGYQVFHLTPFQPDTEQHPYHGVALLIKGDIRAQKVSPFSRPSTTDHETYSRIIAVELLDYDTTVCNVYMPAVRADLSQEENNNKYESTLQYLDTIISGRSNLVVGGDWNTCFYNDKETVRYKILESYIGSNFHSIDKGNLSDPAKFTFCSFMNNSKRHLDMITTTIDPSSVIEYNVLSSDGLGSDHYPIFCSITLSKNNTAINPPRQPPETRVNWSKKQSPEQIVAYKRTVRRRVTNLMKYNKNCDNETLQKLVTILERSALDHFPHIKFKKKRTAVASELWLQTVKPAQSEFQRISITLDTTARTDPAYTTLLRAKAKAKLNFKLCTRRFKLAENKLLADRYDHDSKSVFQSIKKANTTLLSPPKMIDGHVPDQQAEMWSDHYEKTFRGSTHPKTAPALPPGDTALSTTLAELKNAVKKIDTTKAYRRHNHWKLAPDIALELLRRCFNTWIKSLAQPQPIAWDFLHSVISPIPKSAQKPISEIKSYRPIALATSEAFLLEQICLQKSSDYFITLDQQFAYKRSHSTAQAIQIAKQISTVKDAHVGLLDASAAFDTLSHQRIQDELQKRKVPANLLQFIMGLCFQTHFTVKWFDEETNLKIYPSRGIKQGGVISAHLFSITYDELIVELRDSTEHGVFINGTLINLLVYADDLLIVASSSVGLKELYRKVLTFAGFYSDITMNPTKSVILRLGTERRRPIGFGGIPTASSAKYLGAILSENRFCKELEERRCRSALFARYNILLRHSSHLRHFSQRSKLSIINAYGLPYALETMAGVSSLMTNPHRIITMNLWPKSYSIKDGDGFTIRSRTLYHQVAHTASLPERHRLLRNRFILNSRRSKNELVRRIIGALQTINGLHVTI